VDPYYRFLMGPFAIGKPLAGGAVGQVVASKNTTWSVGTYITGNFGAVDYCVTDGAEVAASPADLGYAGYRAVDLTHPLSTAVGILGWPGMTAWVGVHDYLSFPRGGTVIVSAASGTVGNAAGQLAKIGGAGRVIGIAGGATKCAALLSRGFDYAIDYKNENFKAELAKAIPEGGADAYFENVGGSVGLACLLSLKTGGSVCQCGSISQYNNKPGVTAITEYSPEDQKSIDEKKLVIKHVQIWKRDGSAFIEAAKWPVALASLSSSISSGALRYDETIVYGLDQIPATFLSLFSGAAGQGKQVVRLVK